MLRVHPFLSRAKRIRFALVTFALALTAFQTARSQSVISLRAGLLNYAEGRIETTDAQAGKPAAGSYHLRVGEQLRTRRGRAELLLGPSVILRLADESLLEMKDAAIDSPEVELLAGTAIIEAVDLPKGARIDVRLCDSIATIRNSGIYRFDANTGEIRVFEGKTEVARNGAAKAVTKGKMSTAAGITGFDRKSIDRIQRWSARRSVAVANANLISVRTSYGHGWRRAARPWIWSLYMNADAARASITPVPTGF
jgi:hypothetical protein